MIGREVRSKHQTAVINPRVDSTSWNLLIREEFLHWANAEVTCLRPSSLPAVPGSTEDAALMTLFHPPPPKPPSPAYRPLQADFSELLGLKDYMGVMYLITLLEKVAPVSDERVKVTEEALDGVEVVLYQPRQQSEGGAVPLRMAVIYLHGGGWCLGSSSECTAGGGKWCVLSVVLRPSLSPSRELGAHWGATDLLCTDNSFIPSV